MPNSHTREIRDTEEFGSYGGATQPRVAGDQPLPVVPAPKLAPADPVEQPDVRAARITAAATWSAAQIQVTAAKRIAIISAVALLIGAVVAMSGTVIAGRRSASAIADATALGPVAPRIASWFEYSLPRCVQLESRPARHRCYRDARAGLRLTPSQAPVLPPMPRRPHGR